MKKFTKVLENQSNEKYYEISVHDIEWNKIPFHSSKKIMKLEHLEHVDFEVNIRKSDLDRIEFICTTSKHLKSDTTSFFHPLRLHASVGFYCRALLQWQKLQARFQNPFAPLKA